MLFHGLLCVLGIQVALLLLIHELFCEFGGLTRGGKGGDSPCDAVLNSGTT